MELRTNDKNPLSSNLQQIQKQLLDSNNLTLKYPVKPQHTLLQQHQPQQPTIDTFKQFQSSLPADQFLNQQPFLIAS